MTFVKSALSASELMSAARFLLYLTDCFLPRNTHTSRDLFMPNRMFYLTNIGDKVAILRGERASPAIEDGCRANIPSCGSGADGSGQRRVAAGVRRAEYYRCSGAVWLSFKERVTSTRREMARAVFSALPNAVRRK